MHGLTCLFPGDGTARDVFSRRDGAGAGGGGAALPVAEPQVRGRLHELPELRGRVQDQWRSQKLKVGYSQEKENNKLKKLEL